MIEARVFNPIINNVIIPAIRDKPKDTYSVVLSSGAKQSHFKLKNKKRLERELEAEEVRKYIKRINRIKRYFKRLETNIDALAQQKPGFKVAETKRQMEETVNIIEFPEVER